MLVRERFDAIEHAKPSRFQLDDHHRTALYVLSDGSKLDRDEVARAFNEAGGRWGLFNALNDLRREGLVTLKNGQYSATPTGLAWFRPAPQPTPGKDRRA
jgi:hypothetical protein